MNESKYANERSGSQNLFFDEVFVPKGPEHTIYHALGHKPTFLGCDRELFMLNVLICISFLILSFNVAISIGACLLAIFNFYLLLKMGERDEFLRQVYLRQLKYRPYYVAQGNVRCKTLKRY